MAIPENAPEWLRRANTSAADVEITAGGTVIWRGGTWRGGTWEGGVWRGGTWEGGVWRGGVWEGGVWEGGVWEGGTWRGGVWKYGTWEGGLWKDGTWEGGLWKDGTWEGGTWEGGTWRGGTWEGGVWKGGGWRGGVWEGGVWKGGTWEGGFSSPTRASYPVTGNGELIRVGCEKRTIDEWRKVIAGRVPPPGAAPHPNSDAARLLVAAIEAQITYQRVLKEWTPPKGEKGDG